MKVVVCIKQVPDTNEVKLDPVTGTLIREGVPSIINPDDKAGLEAALRLKDQYGAHVTVISMGPPQADLALREALAMGADEAILVTDRAFGGADTWATSSTIASAIENLEYDLIITGRQAIDGDTAQTGPATAAFLGIPQITLASSIDVEDGWVVCERRLEDCTQKVRARMLALVTVTAEMNKPRYPRPVDIVKALKKPRHTWTAQDLGADPSRIGMNGSPTSTRGLMEPPKRKADTKYFQGQPREIAAQIADLLHNERLI